MMSGTTTTGNKLSVVKGKRTKVGSNDDNAIDVALEQIDMTVEHADVRVRVAIFAAGRRILLICRSVFMRSTATVTMLHGAFSRGRNMWNPI